MEARILTEESLEVARSWACARPLEQALLLADITQLADDSLCAGAIEGTHVRGLACCYTGLPFLAVALWSEAPEVAAGLLAALAAQQPRLRQEPAYALVAQPIRRQLEAVARVEEVQEETKRVLPPSGLAPPSSSAHHWETVRLRPGDLPALEDLHRHVPPMAWTPQALLYGPHRGIYLDGHLVAAAGVHFSTPWVTELGHILTRPAHRRRSMAEALIRALVADLQGQTRHIFLMHFDDNEAAGRLYGRLGFAPYQRLFLTRFRLRSAD